MVTNSTFEIQFLQERIESNQSLIRDHSMSIGLMNKVRELYPDEWEIEEYARHNIFLSKEIMENLKEEIQNDQRAIREYDKRKNS